MAGHLPKDLIKQLMSFNALNLHSGNPIIDSLAGMMLNPMGLMASPGRGQSVLDAQNIRYRSRDQMELMRHGLGTSILGQHFGGAGGMDLNKTAGMFASPLLGMPNGPMNHSLVQAFNGGNPVKAIMGMKANSTGLTMGMGFGRITDADNHSVKAAFREFQNTLFKTRTITGEDMNDLISRTSSDTMNNMGANTRGVMGGYISKGADGKESFDFKRYQADGSGKNLLRDTIEARKQELQNSLSGVDLTGTGLDGGNINQTDFDELKKKTKGFTEKISDTMTKAALEALKKADEKTAEIKTKQDNVLKAIDDLATGDKSISEFRSQIGEQVATGTNSKYMRGYSIDQLSKANTMAYDLGLAGASWQDKQNLTLTQQMSKSAAGFARNAGGALRAVSDLTGAEDAEGAMEDLNSLLGNSAGNLGTEQGANEIESLVRRFKASARTAGVGIEAVMSILNEVKALSAAHPQLQYSGGIGAMETSIKSINTTGALASAMGGDWVRKMGGSAELSRQVTETLTRNKTEPVVQKSKGLVGYIASSNLSEADKKKAIDLIEQFDSGQLNGKSHNFNNEAWGSLYENVGKITGDSGSILHRAALSQSSQLAGQMYADANLGRDFDQGAITATGKEFYLAANLAITTDGRKVRNKDGKIMTPEERKKGLTDDLARRAETGEHISTILNRYQLNDNGRLNRFTSDKHFMTNFDMYTMQQQPGYATQLALSKEITNSYAQQEAEMGKQFSQLNQGFNQTLIQGFLNGDYGKGKQELLDAISDDPSRTRIKSMLDSVMLNKQNKTAGSFKSAMLETMGGAEGLDDATVAKNLGLQGRTDIEAVMAQRKVLMGAGGMDQFSSVADKLTIGQLFGTNADNYKDSAAKKQGVSLEEVLQAAKFGKSSGILDDETIRSHSGHMFSDIMGTSPMKHALVQTAHVTYEDVKKQASSLAASKLQANMQGLSDLEYSNTASAKDKELAKTRLQDQLKLYHAAGYLKLKNGKGGASLDNIDWEGSKSGIGSFLDDMGATPLSEGLGVKLGGLKSTDQLSKDEQEELLKYGGATRGQDGKINLDAEGLKKLQQKQSAISAAKKSPDQTLKQYSDLLSSASTKKEGDLLTAKNSLDAGVLEEVGKAFSNGSKDIVGALGRIVESFNSTLK